MGLFGGDSKTTKKDVTNITETTRTQTETVTGTKAGGDVTQAAGPVAGGRGSIAAGRDVGLTGERFANVANNITARLAQGVDAIAAGAQTAQRQSTARAENARALITANRASGGSGSSSGGGGSSGGIGAGVVLVGLGLAFAAAMAMNQNGKG